MEPWGLRTLVGWIVGIVVWAVTQIVFLDLFDLNREKELYWSLVVLGSVFAGSWAGRKVYQRLTRPGWERRSIWQDIFGG